jgi:hypothetical protein
MVIKLNSQLESILTAEARRLGITPEELAVRSLQSHFLAQPAPVVPHDEWERNLFRSAVDCGVSLSDEALSSEGLYE